MKIKLLQLNMNANNYWDSLILFLNSHDFDVIHLQELTGKDTVSGNMNSQIDVFEELQKILSSQYNGELSINTRYSSNTSICEFILPLTVSFPVSSCK